MRRVSLIKNVLVSLLVFMAVFWIGNKIVFGSYELPYIPGGYTEAEIQAQCPIGGCDLLTPGETYSLAGSYAPGQIYSGFYQAPNGNFYPIGFPDPIYNPGGSGGSGSGPDDNGTGACTGVYANCFPRSECSPTCGPGRQNRTCFDTGCGTLQTQSRACQINDPTVWGTPTTCTVNCGGGTQDRTNQCGKTETIACNTSACPAWTKLKDSSFISPNNLYNMIALAPAAYDGDDITEQFFIVGKGGVATAPVISINISNSSPTAKTGNPEYKALYTPTYSMTPALFLSYIKSRKEYKVITNLGEITGSGIYVYNGDVTVSSDVTPFNQGYNTVLVVTGTVTVSPSPTNTFTPTGTAAIMASTINFGSTITEAQGVFIGRTVSTGTNATQGLKIIGNLIAQTTFSNNRQWPTTGRPSVFIKFDQTKYISLFPYLSTASYQWREIHPQTGDSMCLKGIHAPIVTQT